VAVFLTEGASLASRGASQRAPLANPTKHWTCRRVPWPNLLSCCDFDLVGQLIW